MKTDLFSILQLLGSAAMLVNSAIMIVAPQRYRTERSASRERALAERVARGHDRYFEELRTLQSYSQPLNPHTVRIFGVGLFILSAVVFAGSLFQ